MNASPATSAHADLTGYAADIQKATGAPRHLLGLIENIMRQEVFHSTLDWQTRAEFDRGAKRAYALYRRDSAFYDAGATLRAATFQLMQAEAGLTHSQTGGVAAEIAAAELRLDSARADHAAAQTAFDRLCGYSTP